MQENSFSTVFNSSVSFTACPPLRAGQLSIATSLGSMLQACYHLFTGAEEDFRDRDAPSARQRLYILHEDCSDCGLSLVSPNPQNGFLLLLFSLYHFH